MKRIILSIFVLSAVSIFTILASEGEPQAYGCDCSGSAVTVIVCRPPSCPGIDQDLNCYLVDENCNMVVGSCTITSSSNCCTLTTDACSNHKFRVNYGSPLGQVCSTPTFTLSGSPHTVNINCSCP